MNGTIRDIWHACLASIGLESFRVTIVSGGAAGQQYDDGDVRGDATGTLALADDGVNIQSVACDTDGHLQVDVLSGAAGGTEYTEDDAAAANPVGGALLLVRADTPAGRTTTDGDNVAATGTDKGELHVKHTDSVAITHAALTELASAIDTEVQVDVVGALPAGTNAIGKLAANSGVDIGDVDVLSIAAGTNAIGNVGLIGRTTGGMTIFRSLDLDESEEDVKTSAGQVFSISAFNQTAAPLYLKFYNATAANVTVGSTTPVLTFVVPGNADSDGAGFIWNNEIGFAFSTAITVACTTGVADSDTGAPGANDCVINIGYV